MPPTPACHHTRTLAALTLVTCALAPPAAQARPIDDPTLPTGVNPNHHRASSGDLATPVVTRSTQPASNSDALPVVLSSAALLVALSGIGLTVRQRPAPNPDTSRR
jgi:hypothetical protein